MSDLQKIMVPSFDANGLPAGDVELPSVVFGVTKNSNLIYDVVRAEQNNRRQGSHKTKTRKEVSGGGKKPWKQKGTGNARQGSMRSPQWKGGGTVFGPLPDTNYRIDLPRKQRKAGMRSILASRAQEGKGVISVLRGLESEIKECKTSKVYKVFEKMNLLPHSTIVFITTNANEHIYKSFANIRNIQLLSVERLCAPDIYYAGKIVIAESALDYIAKIYQKQERVA